MDFSTSTDVLADVLQRLPPCARRRARLVCKLWRETVDERTTEMQSRAKVLLWNTRTAVAYVVVDDISSSPTGRCRELWSGGSPPMYSQWDADLQLVGTCNGLLCICDNGGSTGGEVALVNPVTCEMLTLPPLPCGDQLGDRRSCRWDKAYSFAYHPTSGRYKVVHVPCIFERAYDFDAVQVLTVEKEATWREVLTPGGARCNLKAGVVSVDGTTYWVTKGGAARVVSLSLDDDERVAGFAGFALPSPALSAGPDNYHLPEVRGRLGVVVHDPFGGTTGVWVRGEKGRWTRRCGLWSQDPTRPHFVHGEHVTTFQGSSLRGHRRKGARLLSSPCDVTVSDKDQGTLLAKVKGGARHYWTFAYVETTEPLGAYGGKPPSMASATALQGEGYLERQLGGLQAPWAVFVLLFDFFVLLLAFFIACLQK
ncbi:hypothetical protein VPH35_098908 [Triticum aestivum]|uniref:F-box protein At3g07870-like n=1 Tax=Triticum aestivum TaxID=4565 RepID=UPI001D019E7E|nr:F-box protein At3g07870-like [Triticum aestivum]